MKLLTVLLVCLSTSLLAQSDTTGALDYPLLTRASGYYIAGYKVTGYGSASFINPQDETPVLKNGKKFVIRYRLMKGRNVPKQGDLRLMQKKGVDETVWYQLLKDSLNHYYLINKPGNVRNPKQEPFPELNSWVHQSIAPDRKSYTLTILEEDVEMTGQIIRKMDTLNAKGRVELYTIYFDTNKYQYEKESELTVNEIVNFLKKEKELSIEIVGSADSTGSPAHNQELSEKRARFIRQALVDKGVQSSRLKARGVGESTGISHSNRDRALQLNRRTVLIKE